MKTIVKSVLVLTLIVGAFCFGRSFRTDEMPEFPELTAGKNNALQAKTHLQQAKHEFGGHRAKAIDYIDKAIQEIDKAIEYGDKK